LIAKAWLLSNNLDDHVIISRENTSTQPTGGDNEQVA